MSETIQGLVADLFRSQARQMVSSLVRILGPQRLGLAEEAVQEALLRALQLWPYQGIPDNPRAWLIQVARNRAIDHLRRSAWRERSLEESIQTWAVDPNGDERDQELALIFLCCHPSLPAEARVALTLKTACGFSTREVARALLAQESAIAQRLVRAKRQIREEGIELTLPFDRKDRLEPVLQVIYLLFNEGYASGEGDEVLRAELCEEAIRLARLVCEARGLQSPPAFALLALLLFHSARAGERFDAAGELVRLDEQRRTGWDARRIGEAYRWLDRAIAGEEETVYHLEAAIAAAHCSAPTSVETNWLHIVELYDRLYAIKPSPVIALNRAIAVGRVRGAEAALAELHPLHSEPRMQSYYLLPAVEGRLWEETGDRDRAALCYRQALSLTGNAATRRFLVRQLEGVSQ